MMTMTGRPDSGQNDPGLILALQARRRQRGWYLAALQMAFLVLISVLLEMFDADRHLSACFYRAGKGWFMAKAPVWGWLYAYGTIPGILLALGALLVCLAGLYFPRLKSWRRPCLLVVLTTVIAAGLLVNAVLKQYWGRPRPSQTVEFGGNWAYRPIFPPGPPGKGASFPCGHCTMGFVFFGLAGFWQRKKSIAVGGIAIGMVLGGILSAARIVQGAHFVSDAIWSLGIVTMTVTILSAYLAPFSGAARQAFRFPASRTRTVLLTAAIILGLLVIAAGFFTRRPYHATKVYPLESSPSVDAIDIRINADVERTVVQYVDLLPSGRLQIDAHGFGWMNFDYHITHDARRSDDTFYVILDVKARSYFAELDHTLTITLPRRTDHPLALMINGRRLDGSQP